MPIQHWVEAASVEHSTHPSTVFAKKSLLMPTRDPRGPAAVKLANWWHNVVNSGVNSGWKGGIGRCVRGGGGGRHAKSLLQGADWQLQVATAEGTGAADLPHAALALPWGRLSQPDNNYDSISL